MLDTTMVLVVATTVLSGIAAGTGLDVSIRQLPARHRIGIIAYSAYSQATDLGTALFWYPSIIYVTASLWVVHLLLTLIWAIPTLPRQRHVGTDEKQLSDIFNRFERMQTVRAINGVLIFGTTLWTLLTYVC